MTGSARQQLVAHLLRLVPRRGTSPFGVHGDIPVSMCVGPGAQHKLVHVGSHLPEQSAFSTPKQDIDAREEATRYETARTLL